MTRALEVEIFGHRYSIASEAEEAYIHRVASHVDATMRSVAKNMKSATVAKVAVLAAMHIAHQYLHAEELREAEGAAYDQRASGLLEAIDKELLPLATQAHKR
ncbi:MAG: cell division protein ZapA [Nitrospirales bacterium]